MNSTQLYIKYLNESAKTVSFYFSITMLPIGFVMNCLSIYIYRKPNLNKTNMGYLFTILSLNDCVSILVYLFLIRSDVFFTYDINADCGYLLYLRKSFLNFNSWIIVLVSMDRFLFVYFLNRTNSQNKKLINSLLFVIFILNFALNSVYFIGDATHNNCTTQYSVVSINIVEILMRVYLPLFSMVLLNISVIMKLFNRVVVPTTSLGLRKEYRFSILTVVLDFLFCVFNVPSSIVLTMNIFRTVADQLNDPVFNAYIDYFYTMSQHIYISYHCLTFMFNLLFNRLYRKELINILKKFI